MNDTAAPSRTSTLADMTRIADPVEATEVLKSVHIAAELHSGDSAPLLAGTVLTLTGSNHLDRRRTEARLMVREALRGYADAVFAPAVRHRLAQLADGPRGDDGLVRDDLLVFTRMVLVELTARMIGLQGVDTPEELESLYQCAERFGEAASVEWSLLDHRQIVEAGLRAGAEFLDRWFARSLARRRVLVDRWQEGKIHEEALPFDLLTMLLVHAPGLDDDGIRREAIFFLLASSSTTTHVAPHLFHELFTWVERHPHDKVLLADPAFVRRAVNEGLRLHPPVPALLRRSLRDITLSTGRVLRAGEYLAVDLDAVNRHPITCGANPDEFDPHRSSLDGAQPYGFSFGNGPHMCLGRPLATSTEKTPADDPGVGTLVRLVIQLTEAGLAPDPTAGPPALRTDTVARRFVSFPVVFTRL